MIYVPLDNKYTFTIDSKIYFLPFFLGEAYANYKACVEKTPAERAGHYGIKNR